MDRWPVIAVAGGSGGLGVSTLVALLALALARRHGVATLVDLDPLGGGIDVRLGAQDADGVRWSGLLLAGGSLEPSALLAGVPRWGRVSLLTGPDPPSEEVALQAVSVARRCGPVVADLARLGHPAVDAVGARAGLTVLLADPTPAGLAAAHAVFGRLPEAGLVVRSSVPGGVAAARAADLVGAPLLGTLPNCRVRVPLAVRGIPRRLTRLAGALAAGALAPGAAVGAAP
jgi:hypothetical protein